MSDKSRLENNNLILQNITNTVMNMPDYVEIHNQDKTININGIYNADTGYTGLGTVTVNVSGGEGDVKLFDSIANMQADPNPTEGDLAVVYYSTGGNLTAETEFQVANFPESVTLPSAITDYIDFQFKALDESIMFDCFGDISSDRFSMGCYIDDGDIRIEYTSSDGINYTRSKFMKNQEEISGTEMDFGTTIIFGSRWEEPTWDDAIGYFIQVGVTEFNGLYQYNNGYNLAKTQLTATSEDVYGKVFYGSNGAEESTLNRTENLTLDQLKHRVDIYSNMSYLTPNSEITDMSKMFWDYNNLITIPNLYTAKVTNMSNMFWSCDNLISVPNFDTSNVTDMSNMFWSCGNLIDVPEFNTSNVTSMDNMFIPCVNLSDTSIQNIINSTPESTQINRKLFANICYNVDRLNSEQKDVLFNKGYLDCDQNTTGWSTQYNFYNGIGWSTIDRGSNFDRYGNTLRIQMNTKLNNSALRDIQLKSIGNDDGILLSMDNTFKGSYSKFNIMNSCNVVINTSNVVSTHSMFSDCQNLTSVSNFNTSNVIDASWMFLGCRKLTSVPNFNFINAINMSQTFGSCYNLTTVPNFNISNAINISSMFGSCTNLTTIPNFNTSNVVDMSYMFSRCNNLTNIPNFDTSNVITMYQTFYYCHNLTTIPNLDTSNVTNMVCMFQTCNRLISIPNLDTSNVTNMYSMFQYCRNIVTIPNFNTSNVTNMNSMFSDCDNLTNVPILSTNNVTDMGRMFFLCHNLTSVPDFDTSNVTDMSEMFQACDNLSNESIQNIINMCLNSNITTSTYKNLNNANSYSPLYNTKFNNSYYSNRLSELTAAGWAY